jgi:hypothetical protein
MRWRTVGRVAATVLVGLVALVAVGAVGIGGATGAIYTPRDPSAPPVPVGTAVVPAHDPGKPTAVVVLSSEGANVADVLAPYEVLAATGAFNLYTVAPQRRPVPLTGNLDVVPDLSFGQLADRLATTPEVIVVPQLHQPGRSSSGCSASAPTAIRCWSACASAPACWPRPACWTAGRRLRTGWA